MSTVTSPPTVSAAEALAKVLTPKPSISPVLRAMRYAEMGEEAHVIFGLLKAICSEMHVVLEEPDWPVAGTDADVLAWCTQITDQMHSDHIGRISVDGRKARYSWYEVKKAPGILSHSLTRLKFTHEIIDARFLRMSGDVDLPPKAQRIHDLLCQSPELEQACRIVTGFLIGEGSEVTSRWTERSAAGKAFDATKGLLKSQSSNILAGLGAVLTAGAATAAIVAAKTAPMAAVAAADPALVLGDIIFYGWKD